MRITLIVILLFVAFKLAALPTLEPKPINEYFVEYQPVKAPQISHLVLKQGDRLAICGDSITEQKMYSRLVEDYLTMCVPELNISVRQYGWSGEKAPGFLARMTNDCLRFQPTIATTCYGMNDFEYRPYEDRIGQTYRKYSTAVVEAFKIHGIQVILGSPGCVSKVPHWAKDTNDTVANLNLSLCNLRNIDIEIAQKEKIGFADVFWPMLTGGFVGEQKYGKSYGIPGRDGVHPYWAGHLIMAYAFLKALGLNGDIGTFTVNLKTGKMKVSTGHKLISARSGEYIIESFRYPFCPCEPAGQNAASYPVCGRDAVTSDDSIRSGMTLVPFNQELNRLMLVVQNCPAEHYEVTWANTNRTFSAAQLARGINLSAEFADNPFGPAFAKVDAAVAAKQVYETKEMKELFRPGNRPNMEQIVAQTDKVVDETEKEHDALAAAVHAAFVPVVHTITITAE
jgi:hypothetical protein